MALAFGCTLAELDARLSADELSDWMAYYQLEPWGAWRDNWHAALLAKLIYDVNRGKHPAAKMKDFMYSDAEVKAHADARTFIARLDSMAKRR